MPYDQNPTPAPTDSPAPMPATPPTPDKAGSMSANELCVPLETLQMPGQDDQMMNPEMGDPVTVTIEGKVSRIDTATGNAYVAMETANGKPLTQAAEKVTDTPGDQDFAQLRDQASEMDRRGGAM